MDVCVGQMPLDHLGDTQMVFVFYYNAQYVWLAFDVVHTVTL